MFRKLLLVSVAASSLAACAGVDGRQPLSPLVSTGADQSTVASVQSVATQICGFVPAASTVIDILTTFTGGGAIAGLVERAASGICSAVTAKGARRGVTPRYRGVAIRGEFVRR